MPFSSNSKQTIKLAQTSNLKKKQNMEGLEAKQKRHVDEVRKVRKKYVRSSRWAYCCNLFLLTIVGLGPLGISVRLVFSDDKFIPILFGFVLTLAAVLSTVWNPGDKARYLRLASSSLRDEINLFDVNGGIYKGKSSEDALSTFVERTGSIRSGLRRDITNSSIRKTLSDGAPRSDD